MKVEVEVWELRSRADAREAVSTVAELMQAAGAKTTPLHETDLTHLANTSPASPED